MEQGETPGRGAVGVQGPRPVLSRGPSWGHGGGYRRCLTVEGAPPGGQDILRAPGKAPVGRVSRRPRRYTPAAQGLPGPLHRAWWAHCQGASAPLALREGLRVVAQCPLRGSQAPPLVPATGWLLSEPPPNPAHLNRATPTPACKDSPCLTFPLMTQGLAGRRPGKPGKQIGKGPTQASCKQGFSTPCLSVGCGQGPRTPSAISGAAEHPRGLPQGPGSSPWQSMRVPLTPGRGPSSPARSEEDPLRGS